MCASASFFMSAFMPCFQLYIVCLLFISKYCDTSLQINIHNNVQYSIVSVFYIQHSLHVWYCRVSICISLCKVNTKPFSISGIMHVDSLGWEESGVNGMLEALLSKRETSVFPPFKQSFQFTNFESFGIVSVLIT